MTQSKLKNKSLKFYVVHLPSFRLSKYRLKLNKGHFSWTTIEIKGGHMS